jgi:hypothetical protein
MEYKLTSKYQHSKLHADGKRRNKLLYFLNDVLILEQKVPFDESYERGFQNRTSIYDEFLLNNNLFQKRKVAKERAWWIQAVHGHEYKIREVKFPVSKKILKQFNIPKGTIIKIER